MKKNTNRRDFLKNSAFASMGMLTVGQLHTGAVAEMPKGATILFQGDSITDAHRDRAAYYANNARGLGVGYVYQIVSQMLGSHPGQELQCYNRGISGHKVFQLADRWEDDCLHLQPDVLSILIGVNDFWHMLSGNYDGTVAVYEKDFRQLLMRTKKALPKVKLIIAEPFVVPGGSAVSDSRWKSEFPAYRQAARKIADEFGASFVPFQQTFDEALASAPVSYWCPDGVHPSIAGAHLMARDWLKAFNTLSW